MTDVFGMFPTTSNSNRQTDKKMLQLNNYTSVGFIDNQMMYGDLMQDENSNCFYNNQYRVHEEQSPHNKRETIHSGHFMVSEIDDADNEKAAEEEVIKSEEEALKDEQKIVEDKLKDQLIVDQSVSYNAKHHNKKKNWNIDYPKTSPSLDILFKDMHLGENSRLTSPKWKQFKGLKISLKSKIRVNNLIWRAWHIKYVLGKLPAINPFPSQPATESLETNHLYIAHRPEVVMKIGKYFKANNEFIGLEYNKWRRYYKENILFIQNQRNQFNNQSNSDAFSNPYDSSNYQFNMGSMYNPMNNYSSAQLGYGAELMQPEFSYNIQSDFMDTIDYDPCLQSLFPQKNSILQTVIEDEILLNDQPQTKLSETSSQSIYQQQATNSTLNTSYDAQIQAVDNQMSSQINNQLNNSMQQQTTSQLSASPVNYNFINYQSQPLTQNQMSPPISYRQNYLSNNLIVDQQNVSSNLQSTLQGNINNSLVNQQSSLSSSLSPNQTMVSMDQHQLSNSNQVNNNQFVAPKPVKQKIRSRSVSSLPPQQQMQLQRQHMIENSSSLMEINQQVCTNQNQFHNTTSNLISTQQQNDNISNLESHLLSDSRSSTYHQRNSSLNPMVNNLNNINNINNQVMQQQQNLNTNLTSNLSNTNQLQTTTNSYYSNMNNQQLIDYNENRATSLHNQTTSSTSFYNQTQQQQLSNSSYSNNNNKYQQSTTDTSSNLISQLLQSTNATKLNTSNLTNNLNSQNSNNLPYKRNSTGTYPNNFQYCQDQFSNNSPISSSSTTNLLMNTSNVNTSSISNNSNGNNGSINNQFLRKTSNLTNQLQPNQLFNSQPSFVNQTNLTTSSMNQRQHQMISQSNLMNSDYQQQKPINKLNSSLENLNKSTKTRIKREQHRKLSTGRMRSNSSLANNLNRSNSSKSINHSSVSPNSSLQSTILNQTAKLHNASNMTNDLVLNTFDRNSNLINLNNQNNLSNSNLNNLSSLNANTNSSSHSSTPTLQSPLQANSPFASSLQNEYSNDSIPFFQSNQNAFGLSQNLANSQMKPAIKSSTSSHLTAQNPLASTSSTSNNQNSTSPLSSSLVKNERDTNQYKEHRRVNHINAEQKRRCNIKHGFDTLRAILPSISSNNNTKISKAAMLQKGAEHIRQTRIEHEAQLKEIEALRSQIDNLNQTIGIFQNQLPVTGAPAISGMRPGQFKERFEDYVREKTNQNWKFWMFSIIMEPLLDSYNNTIPTTNFDELTSSVLRWLDQSCNLINLRRDVLNSLRIIARDSNVLINPATLSEESLAAVKKKKNNKKK